MKYKLNSPHYDMQKGTLWYDAGYAVSQPGQGESRLVTEIDGDTQEGCLRVVPIEKLEKV